MIVTCSPEVAPAIIKRYATEKSVHVISQMITPLSLESMSTTYYYMSKAEEEGKLLAGVVSSSSSSAAAGAGGRRPSITSLPIFQQNPPLPPSLPSSCLSPSVSALFQYCCGFPAVLHVAVRALTPPPSSPRPASSSSSPSASGSYLDRVIAELRDSDNVIVAWAQQQQQLQLIQQQQQGLAAGGAGLAPSPSRLVSRPSSAAVSLSSRDTLKLAILMDLRQRHLLTYFFLHLPALAQDCLIRARMLFRGTFEEKAFRSIFAKALNRGESEIANALQTLVDAGFVVAIKKVIGSSTFTRFLIHPSRRLCCVSTVMIAQNLHCSFPRFLSSLCFVCFSCPSDVGSVDQVASSSRNRSREAALPRFHGVLQPHAVRSGVHLLL